LSRPQRELLHTVLDHARRDPGLFGGANADWFPPMVNKIVDKLPPRGAGTY
jgi:hypothetical protein